MAVQGLSIQVKLPLLIGGLLVAVTGIYSWAAYQTVRRSTATAVASRLGTVVDQLAGTLQASRDQLLATARTVADSAAVRAYALQPGDSRRAAAQAALRPSGAQAQQIAATELWSADRRRLLVVGDADLWSKESAARAVLWHRIAQSADTREQNSRLSRLIGSDAHFYIGNTADDVWTDLGRRVPPPPVDVAHPGGVLRYERAGAGPVLAGARLVRRTPWVLWSSSRVTSYSRRRGSSSVD